MLQLGKIRNHIVKYRNYCLAILALFLLGFFIGCFYANLCGETDFETGLQSASLFIEAAKKSELDYQLLLFEESLPYLLIAGSALCLFGIPVITFLVFKTGFSVGFFLTFLVKGLALKGFFLGAVFLLVQVLFFLPALLVIAIQSFRTNLFLLFACTHRLSPKQSLKNELLFLAVALFSGVLLLFLGVGIKYLSLPPLCNYLFL